MLHEILLALSGFSSPFLQQVTETPQNEADKTAIGLFSPPEKALLSCLAYLSNLHVRLKEDIKAISASHPSIICKAVSTAISTDHLGRFQKKILEVEKSILSKDAAYVGGYGIVPLSALVGEFAPWTRRFEWLSRTTNFMGQPNGSPGEQSFPCTGAGIINFLRAESRTGYQDLEEMAQSLISAAEMVWIRQLSAWLLQGSLPSFGQADFLIQREKPSHKDDRLAVFSIKQGLEPEFVSLQTARSILFIGRSLNHLKTQGDGWDSVQALLPSHIDLMQSLARGVPIKSSDLADVVASVRSSISKNILSRLLPISRVRELLDVLQDFFLLRKGEFSTALVSSAAQSLRERDGKLVKGKTLRKAGTLDDVNVRDAELATILNETWVEMEALQNDDDPVDEELELARDCLTLTTACPYNLVSQDATEDHCLTQCATALQLFHNLLFPNPTYLSINIQPPLDMFVSAQDIATYSLINAFLLGIRRTKMQLDNLWKNTSLRRTHPSPYGPPFSNTHRGETALLNRQERDNDRSLIMRKHWVTAHSTAYVLSEISAYFHGEIIEEAWKHFHSWLGRFQVNYDVDISSERRTEHPTPSRNLDQTGSLLKEDEDPTAGGTQPDPENLTHSHRSYLSALTSSLLLVSRDFCQALHRVLLLVQHYTALFARLQQVQRNLDLEEDEGVLDALADNHGEERRIITEMERSRKDVAEGLKQILKSLQTLESRQLNTLASGFERLQINGPSYSPRQNAHLERLLIKLAFMSSEESNFPTENNNP